MFWTVVLGIAVLLGGLGANVKFVHSTVSPLLLRQERGQTALFSLEGQPGDLRNLGTLASGRLLRAKQRCRAPGQAARLTAERHALDRRPGDGHV